MVYIDGIMLYIEKINKYISNEAILIVIVVCIYLCLIRKNTKLNIKAIVQRHIKTLRSYGEEKISRKDTAIFLWMPIFISILLTIKSLITIEGIGIILTVFSIFAGLMFNLLLLIMDVGRRVKEKKQNQVVDARKQKIAEELVGQTYANVGFCIIVALVIICISLFFVAGINNNIFILFISVALYFLIIVFVMTLFMILKRIFKLLDNELIEERG